VDQVLLGIASVALIALTVLWIAGPLIRGTGAVGERSAFVRALAELMLRRETVLKEIRDLDGDFAAGKLDESDYQSQRNVLLAEGVAVLQRIDALRAEMSAADSDLEAQIEAAVAERRAVTPVAATPTCPQCGTEVRAGARFCDHCGHALDTVPSDAPRGLSSA
jgi:hypothetical protein